MHGNDAVGQKILLNLVEYLCRNYGSEPLITQLVNSTSVHILPCVNPDGYGMAEEGMGTENETQFCSTLDNVVNQTSFFLSVFSF